MGFSLHPTHSSPSSYPSHPTVFPKRLAPILFSAAGVRTPESASPRSSSVLLGEDRLGGSLLCAVG